MTSNKRPPTAPPAMGPATLFLSMATKGEPALEGVVEGVAEADDVGIAGDEAALEDEELSLEATARACKAAKLSEPSSLALSEKTMPCWQWLTGLGCRCQLRILEFSDRPNV